MGPSVPPAWTCAYTSNPPRKYFYGVGLDQTSLFQVPRGSQLLGFGLLGPGHAVGRAVGKGPRVSSLCLNCHLGSAPRCSEAWSSRGANCCPVTVCCDAAVARMGCMTGPCNCQEQAPAGSHHASRPASSAAPHPARRPCSRPPVCRSSRASEPTTKFQGDTPVGPYWQPSLRGVG